MYKYLLPLLLFAEPVCCLAQEDSFVLSGTVVERQSKEPIASVSVRSRQQFTTTDANGEFKIMVRPGDTLVISHISYQQTNYRVEAASGYSTEILLDEKVVDLREVEVNAFMPEERFKREVLMAVPKYDYENKLVERNRQMIRQIVPLGYAPESNPYGLFKDATSVSEVRFFSTNPSMGLLKALKQIGQKRTFIPPPSPTRPSGEPLYRFGVRKSNSRILNNQE